MRSRIRAKQGILMFILGGVMAGLALSGNGRGTVHKTIKAQSEMNGLWSEHAANDFAGGTGLVDDPFLIGTPAELAKLANDVNAETDKNLHTDEYFQLLNDIDLEGRYWTPIGSVSGNKFQGNFDGNNFRIMNMMVAETATGAGFFGGIETSTIGKTEIKNLGIVGGSVSGKQTVGALAGYNWQVKITDCYNEGCPVTGSGDTIGGLVGFNRGVMTNCYNTADVLATGSTSNQQVGGLAGTNSTTTMINCYNLGTVTGSQSRVGGLVGWNTLATIHYCFNGGDVMAASNTGGLVGYADNNSKIWSSYNKGSVYITSGYAGGILGYASGNTIENCYSRGAVGGKAGVANLGGINGYGGTNKNSFYDKTVIEASAFASKPTVASVGGTNTNLKSLTTEQMTGLTASSNMNFGSPDEWIMTESDLSPVNKRIKEVIYYPQLVNFAGSSNRKFVGDSLDSVLVKIHKTSEIELTIGDWTYGEVANEPQINLIRADYELGAVIYTYKERNEDEDAFSEEVPYVAGEYTVRAFFAETEDYEAFFLTEDFTILKRAITIVPDNLNKTIRMRDPDLTYQITTGSLAAGDTISLTREQGEDVGSYKVFLNEITNGHSYEVTVIEAYFEILADAAFSLELSELISLMDATDTCKDFDQAAHLRGLYDALPEHEKLIFNNTVCAEDGNCLMSEKLAYMESLAGIAVPATESNLLAILIANPRTNLVFALVIGLLGLSAAGGYYFLCKKKNSENQN